MLYFFGTLIGFLLGVLFCFIVTKLKSVNEVTSNLPPLSDFINFINTSSEDDKDD